MSRIFFIIPDVAIRRTVIVHVATNVERGKPLKKKYTKMVTEIVIRFNMIQILAKRKRWLKYSRKVTENARYK